MPQSYGMTQHAISFHYYICHTIRQKGNHNKAGQEYNLVLLPGASQCWASYLVPLSLFRYENEFDLHKSEPVGGTHFHGMVWHDDLI